MSDYLLKQYRRALLGPDTTEIIGRILGILIGGVIKWIGIGVCLKIGWNLL